MIRTILIAGLVAGAIAGGLCSLFALTLSDHMTGGYGMLLGYTTMLIALSIIFVAVKRYRDGALGGVIRFWPALGMGLAIALVAGVLYALAWEGALLAMGGPDGFIDGYVAQLRAKGGASAAEIAQIEAMRISYRNPLFRLPITFSEIAPVGVLVALLSAALLRNPRFMPARAV